MGINPTPFSYKSFTFDGKSTREFGVYITGEGVFNAPERAVEMISIPGRDGEYALDQGHFNNIEVTYRAGIVADSTTDFAEAISNFRNWLASRKGYCRLTDEYNTEEYRMAVFKNAIALEHEGLLTGEFDVTFDCKPQRYLAIGEELVEIGAWGNTETAEGEIVTIDASSDTAVKALTVDLDPIQDLHGYDNPWVGGAGKNKLPYPYYSNSRTVNGITFTVNGDTSVTVQGTASGNANFNFSNNLITDLGLSEGDSLIVTDGTTYDSSSCYSRILYADDSSGLTRIQNSYTLTITSSMVSRGLLFELWVGTGVNVSTARTYYPMIRKSTEADATWEPYENICPISGSTEVKTTRTGKNLCKNTTSTSTINTVVWTVNADGTMNANGTASSASIKYWYIDVPAGNYYFNGCPSGGSSTKYDLYIWDATTNSRAKQWDGTTNVVSDYGSSNNNQVQILSGHNYSIQCRVMSGYNAQNLVFKPMIRSASVTDGTFEPYNVNTYTTPLGRTVYDGTLDVVSGVLTVTHGILDMGDVTWTASGSSQTGVYRMATAISGAKLPANNDTKFKGIASAYSVVTANNTYSTTQGVSMSTGGYLIIYDSNYNTSSSASAFKTAMTGQKIVYELATPQTYQLTPQQVELLLGENNIFADSGNVTVEYGHNPTILTNPTWFPSKPLLAVDGYGEIKFNNRSIVDIENATIGKVIVFDGFSRSVAEMPYTSSLTLTLDTSALETSDEIVVDGIRETITFTYTTNIVSMSTTTATGMTETHSYSGKVATFNTNIDAETIEYGTSKTWSAHLYASIVTNSGGTTNTPSTFLDFSYDGAQTITVTFRQRGSNSSSSFSVPSLNGTSTRSIITDTIYIDCDIGEAYMIQDGAPVSLNQHIDLGSDLPILTSGDTEVTYDNTITKVEVQPNYWKV